MKNTKLVAAAAIVAMGGAVALQTAQGRTPNFDYSGYTVTSTTADVQDELCRQLSTGELSKVGCPQ